MNFQSVLLFPIMVIYCLTLLHFSDASSSSTLAILNNNAAVVQPNNFLKDGSNSNNNIQKSVKTIPSSIGNNQVSVSALSGRKEEMIPTTRTDAAPARSTFLRGALVSAPLAFISSLMSADEVYAKTSLSPKEKSLKSKSIEDFVGSYSDPKHPGCARTISVNEKKTAYVVDGQDGKPGCENPKVKKMDWVIPATPSNDGRTASFDFSVKKGPKSIMGLFFETDNAAVGGKSYKGIYFEDGNIWTKIAD